jgi:hypothetical protein
MLFLLPNFFYAIVLWVTYSQLPGLEDTAPLSKELYVSLIGILKYAPQITLSVFLGNLVNNKLNKRNYILGLSFFVIILSLFSQLEVNSLTNLLLTFIVVILSSVYEPALNAICSSIAEKKENYLFVNNAQLISRTFARFLAPLIFLYILKDHFSIIQILIAFLVLALISSFFIGVPSVKISDASGVSNKSVLSETLSKVRKSKPVTILTVVYCLFYLSINYLEYFTFLINKESEINLSLLFSVLGAGFLFINILFLIWKPSRKIQNTYLSVSLLVSGASLILLPFVSDWLKLVCIFIIGSANGGAVPVAMSIFQEVLKKERIASFIGFLLTIINLCAVISMGIAYIITTVLSYEYVFIVDGLIIGFGGLIVFVSYRRGDLNV